MKPWLEYGKEDLNLINPTVACMSSRGGKGTVGQIGGSTGGTVGQNLRFLGSLTGLFDRFKLKALHSLAFKKFRMVTNKVENNAHNLPHPVVFIF